MPWNWIRNNIAKEAEKRIGRDVLIMDAATGQFIAGQFHRRSGSHPIVFISSDGAWTVLCQHIVRFVEIET